MATLATIRREQYARYQPLFWRPAAGSSVTGSFPGIDAPSLGQQPQSSSRNPGICGAGR